MDKKEKSTQAPVDLATMLGNGDEFIANGKPYIIKPLQLKHVPEFMKDSVCLGSQIFNLASEKAKKNVDKWLSLYAKTKDGEPVSLQKAFDDGWDIIELKNFFKKLCDFSG